MSWVKDYQPDLKQCESQYKAYTGALSNMRNIGKKTLHKMKLDKNKE